MHARDTVLTLPCSCISGRLYSNVSRAAPTLQVLEGMREEIVRTVLAASSRSVGERAWLLPRRLHPLRDRHCCVFSRRHSRICCTHYDRNFLFAHIFQSRSLFSRTLGVQLTA